MTAGPAEKPLVTVIIPTYRRPAKAREAVVSALHQTWPHIEVVVVSDGPDADTRAAMPADARVRYLELGSNQGPAAARNAGVAASRGEWLTFLDDDDLMLPEKVEAQMRIASGCSRQVLIACRAAYRHGTRLDVWPARPIRPAEDLAEYLLRRPAFRGRPGIIPLQTLLMHKSVVEAIPFATHEDHEDWAWLLEAWHLHGARVEFVWEPLVIYHIETEEASRSRRNNWNASLEWAKRHRHWIGDKAYCSFLSTKAARKAKRAGSWKGLGGIGWEILTNRPGPLELLFFLGVVVAPSSLLKMAWRRSLHERSAAGPIDSPTVAV